MKWFKPSIVQIEVLFQFRPAIVLLVLITVPIYEVYPQILG